MHKRIIASIVLISILLVIVLSRVKVSNDLRIFFPNAETQADRLLYSQLDSGISTNVIFLGLEGLPKEKLAALSNAMVSELRNLPDFGRVLNNSEGLSSEAVDFIFKYRYLLTHNDLSQQFSVEGLHQTLKSRLNGLSLMTSSLEKKFLRQDPTGELVSLLADWQDKMNLRNASGQSHGVWFSVDQSRSLILAEVTSDIKQIENQYRAVNEIQATYQKYALDGSHMIMTGPIIFTVESSEAIKTDATNLTIFSVIFFVSLLCVVYRSLQIVPLIIIPLVIGILTAVVCILLLYGQIHGITLAFGITLVGVAVDYPIHILTGLGNNLADNKRRVDSVWRTLCLGVLSTVISYAAFLFAGFPGLQQLGLFTIVGLIVTALTARWVLPYWQQNTNRENAALGFLHAFLTKLVKVAPRFRWLVPFIFLVGLIFLFVTNKPVLNLSVDSLSPISVERKAQEKMLRGDLGFWYGGHLLLVTAKDKEGVLQKEENITPLLNDFKSRGVIGDYDTASEFLPSQQKQNSRKQQIKSITDISENLEKAMRGLPFKFGTFDPFLQQINQIEDLPLLNLSMLAGGATGKEMGSFLFKFLNSLVFDLSDGAVGVILLHNVQDRQDLQVLAEADPSVYYMHLKTASTNLVARSVYRVGLLMLACIFIIYLLMAYSFKSLIRPLRILVPTFSAAISVATLMVVFNFPLNVFHLISLLLVVGLGLDYALFFNRLTEETQDYWDDTFRALWICATTTILVFGVLFFSDTPPLKSIGMVVGLGAFMSMIYAAMWSNFDDKKHCSNEV